MNPLGQVYSHNITFSKDDFFLNEGSSFYSNIKHSATLFWSKTTRKPYPFGRHISNLFIASPLPLFATDVARKAEKNPEELICFKPARNHEIFEIIDIMICFGY